MESSIVGGIEWVMAVNLVIWTGLFLYLFYLGRKIARLEDLGSCTRSELRPEESR